jgi:serralysin
MALRQGTFGNDNLVGTELDDNILGVGGNDILIGDGGNDYLSGGTGNDRLSGGLGNDLLNGGAGQDTMVFDTALGPTNVDTIGAFSVFSDTIALDKAIFSEVTGTYTLDPNEFVIGPEAVDAEDRIIYNDATGALLYDADGGGGGQAIQFANIAAGLPLTNADFIVF